MNGGYFSFRKEELENEIMKTQTQLEALQTALGKLEETEKEVPRVLNLEQGKLFYYMGMTGAVMERKFYGNDYADMKTVLNRRAFKTKKYADIFSKKTQFIADLLHFKYLYDRDYEPNWDSENEPKYGVYYNIATKKFDWHFARINENIESVYFSTEQLAKRCVDWLNKKRN